MEISVIKVCNVIVCANLIIGQLAHRKVGQYQYN